MANERIETSPPPKPERSRAPSARELALRAELIQVRHELRCLLEELERGREKPKSPVKSAVVTAVVAKTQLIHQGEPYRDYRGE